MRTKYSLSLVFSRWTTRTAILLLSGLSLAACSGDESAPETNAQGEDQVASIKIALAIDEDTCDLASTAAEDGVFLIQGNPGDFSCANLRSIKLDLLVAAGNIPFFTNIDFVEPLPGVWEVTLPFLPKGQTGSPQGARNSEFKVLFNQVINDFGAPRILGTNEFLWMAKVSDDGPGAALSYLWSFAPSGNFVPAPDFIDNTTNGTTLTDYGNTVSGMLPLVVSEGNGGIIIMHTPECRLLRSCQLRPAWLWQHIPLRRQQITLLRPT